jgi:hypothetical protein
MKTKILLETFSTTNVIERLKRADYKRIFNNDCNRLAPDIPVRALIDTSFDFSDKSGYPALIIGVGGSNWKNFVKQTLKSKPKPKTFSLAQVTLKISGGKRTLAIELLAGKPTPAIVTKALNKRPPSTDYIYTVNACPNFGEDLNEEDENGETFDEKESIEETLSEDLRATAPNDFLAIQADVQLFRAEKAPEKQLPIATKIVAAIKNWLTTHNDPTKDVAHRTALEKLLPQITAHEARLNEKKALSEENQSLDALMKEKSGGILANDFSKIQDNVKKFRASKNVAEQIMLGDQIVKEAEIWIVKHADSKDAARKDALNKMLPQIKAHLAKLKATDTEVQALDGVLYQDSGKILAETDFGKIQNDIKLMRQTPDPQEQLKLIEKIYSDAGKWLQTHTKDTDEKRRQALNKLMPELLKHKASLAEAYTATHNKAKGKDEEDEESPIAAFKEIRLDYKDFLVGIKATNIKAASLLDEASELEKDIKHWLNKLYPVVQKSYAKQADQAKTELEAMLTSINEAREKLDLADEIAEFRVIEHAWTDFKKLPDEAAAKKLRKIADISGQIKVLEARL